VKGGIKVPTSYLIIKCLSGRDRSRERFIILIRRQTEVQIVSNYLLQRKHCYFYSVNRIY